MKNSNLFCRLLFPSKTSVQANVALSFPLTSTRVWPLWNRKRADSHAKCPAQCLAKRRCLTKVILRSERNTRYLKKFRCWWNWHWSEDHSATEVLPQWPERQPSSVTSLNTEMGKPTDEWRKSSEISSWLNTTGVCRVYWWSLSKTQLPWPLYAWWLPPQIPYHRGETR